MSDNGSSNPNPFESPQTRGAAPPIKSAGVTCPACGSADYRVPSFTWWGGAIGHRIVNHVVCNQCGKGFNGKTGKDNTTAIVIYNVVIAVIAFVICFVLASG